MNRLLLIAVAAACLTTIHYARRARRVPELAQRLASTEVRLAAMTAERDAYLRAALKRAGAGVLARIAAEREEEVNQYGPMVSYTCPLDRLGMAYSDSELLAEVGLRDCE